MDLLAMDGSVHEKQGIRSSLGTWWLGTHEICYTFSHGLKAGLFNTWCQSLTSILHVESASATASQIREMNSGISTMRFQYLHSLVLLLNGGDSSSVIRLSSAREAISTMSCVVSNWSSACNGVVWYVHVSSRPLFQHRLVIKLIRQLL